MAKQRDMLDKQFGVLYNTHIKQKCTINQLAGGNYYGIEKRF